MPKAKPVSLHPLDFDEAVKALIRVNPDKVGITPKRRKRRSRRKKINSRRQ
jgi:hypothetical protein